MGPRREARRRDYKPGVGGGSVYFEGYREGEAGRLYPNWILVCNKHEGCQKTRGVGYFSTKRYGELEPLAFLHAWRDMDVLPGKTHRQCTPSVADIDAQMESHMEAFAAINAEFRPEA